MPYPFSSVQGSVYKAACELLTGSGLGVGPCKRRRMAGVSEAAKSCKPPARGYMDLNTLSQCNRLSILHANI